MNNYLLRVPGSINSKTKVKVQIKQRWNGIRPDIKYVYGDYLAYLVDKMNEEKAHRSRSKSVHKIDWIEYCKKGERK
jgi:hypothetical protein